ncbi:type II secretion system inner membrane protein GspF [Xanthomonadaceae bacterium JHOS43]|nr:type II secretion system inner membrane protein GspF [Xanthomonadaceae bacterium JHOS43]MCX7564035.1 type II secretion system inner membrane protein GspF [Xanthomonadaceae bacterium XH05]
MPAFAYHALDADGRTRKGVLQADTARAARASLRERGLNALDVSPLSDAVLAGEATRGLSSAQLALLTRQLSALIGSGLPIDEALGALAEGSEGKLRSRLVALRARVMEGATLAAAMAESPGTFPVLYRATIAAGEASGRLDTVLARLADYTESRDALRSKVILALAYPLLLTCVALLVVAGLMVWVVPQVIGVFDQAQQALPWATRVLISISALIERFGLWWLLLPAVVALAIVIVARTPSLRAAWQRAVLKLPVIGRLVRAADTARFARTLALLVGSAVPLLDALNIASQVVGNAALREALTRVAVRVREGQGLARSLEESGQFPPVALRLVASGEKSGRLDTMLFDAATQQERELDTALGIATTVLGPGVILLVGGLVLFIVLAILLPIFSLNTLVR